MKFADNLRNLRVSRGLSQQALAKGLGTSQASITSWELEKREPDFATIRRIADFFGVPMSSLLPSDGSIDESYVGTVAETLHRNPKLQLLFDRTKFLSDSDLDAILNVVNAISKERNDD